MQRYNLLVIAISVSYFNYMIVIIKRKFIKDI